MSMDNKTDDRLGHLKKRLASIFTPLVLQRLFSGIGSVLFSILLVFALFNSPITGALEAETLRWRFEVLHRFTHRIRSKDITVVFLKSMTAGAAERPFDRGLTSLLNKIERAHPAVIGIDLTIDRIESAHRKVALGNHANVVLGVKSSATAVPGIDVVPGDLVMLPASRRGSIGLPVEENGMVAQLPAGSALLGKFAETAPFCHVVASLYRSSKHIPNSATITEPLHFINYSDLDFGALDSTEVLSDKFDPGVLRDKIVLIGDTETSYVVPGPSPRIHKADKASEVYVQAFAIQTLVDESTIAPSPPSCFRLMLYALAVIGLIMPVCSHSTRLIIFAISLMSLLIGSCLAVAWGHVFIQIWTFLIGLITSFIAGTVAYAVSDLKERNRRLRQTQTILEKRNLELEVAQTELEKRGKEIARARELGMEEERKRIALDLHDDALKELFLASSAVEQFVSDGLEPTIGTQVQDKLREASDKIRRIMANLSPSALSVCGLPGAIENLADTLRKETVIEVSFRNEVGSELDAIDENQALLIYRIVQEAFNNIQKHSKATKVSVSLTMQDSKLDIAIADNGIGMNGRSVRPNAYGLDNMRYRADLIGAQIAWRQSSEYSTGTQVNIQLVCNT
jgi:signal transduction histidine kinase